MVNTAEIIFTGICLFLRPQDVTQPPEAAVFVDGRKDLDGSRSYHRHDLFLVVDPDENRVADYGVYGYDTLGPFGKKYRVYPLNDKLIKVHSQASELTFSAADLDEPDHAVPHLKDVWPRWMIGGARSPVDGLHDEVRPAALDGIVNARFQMPAVGDLRVTFSDDDRWRFVPRIFGNPRVEGAIPQEVTLVQTLRDDKMELLIHDITTGVHEGTVTVSFRRGHSSRLMALFANVPAHDLFPTDVCATEIDCATNPTHICCRDEHFSIYYKAFKNPPGNPPLPNRVTLFTGLQGRPVTLFRAGGANCGPAQEP